MASRANPHESVTASFAKLRALSSFISSSLDTLERTCSQLDTPWPDLDKPVYSRDAEDNTVDARRVANEDVSRAVSTIVAAAFQLVASVREPRATVIQDGCSFHYSSCLRIAAELHVSDILRDAGSNGMHVDQIASMVNVDASKLSRVLRLLATHHVFNEILPDVYTNNRISAALEKGQGIDDLIKTPSAKYDKPESATSALMCWFTDIIFKSSSVLLETLTDPRTAFSGSPGRCAVAKSAELNPQSNVSTNQTANIEDDFSELLLYDLVAREVPPSSPLRFPSERLRSFGVAMQAVSNLFPTEEVLGGFDFGSIEATGVVHDVGGGVGFASEILARKYTNLRLVIQDRPEVCEDGVKRWEKVFPEALSSGRVSFQAQDFLSPQQKPLISGTPVYLLKHCLFNWSDSFVVEILRHLSNAVNATAKIDASARRTARLLVLDALMPHATRVGSEAETVAAGESELGDLSHGEVEKPDIPLLSNWGVAAALGYYMDVKMLTVSNGQQRTFAHIRSLFRTAGWEVVKVTRPSRVAEFFAMVEARIV